MSESHRDFSTYFEEWRQQASLSELKLYEFFYSKFQADFRSAFRSSPDPDAAATEQRGDT